MATEPCGPRGRGGVKIVGFANALNGFIERKGYICGYMYRLSQGAPSFLLVLVILVRNEYAIPSTVLNYAR